MLFPILLTYIPRVWVLLDADELLLLPPSKSGTVNYVGLYEMLALAVNWVNSIKAWPQQGVRKGRFT